MANFDTVASDWEFISAAPYSLSFPIAGIIGASGKIVEIRFRSRRAGFTESTPFKVYFVGIGVSAGMSVIGTIKDTVTSRLRSRVRMLQIASAESERVMEQSQQILDRAQTTIAIRATSGENVASNAASQAPSETFMPITEITRSFSAKELDGCLMGIFGVTIGVAYQYTCLAAWGIRGEKIRSIVHTIGLSGDLASADVSIGVLMVEFPSNLPLYRLNYAQGYIERIFITTPQSNRANRYAFGKGFKEADDDVRRLGLNTVRGHILRYYCIPRERRSNYTDEQACSVGLRHYLNNTSNLLSLSSRISEYIEHAPVPIIVRGWYDYYSNDRDFPEHPPT